MPDSDGTSQGDGQSTSQGGDSGTTGQQSQATAAPINPVLHRRLSDENAKYRVRLKGLSAVLGTDDPDEILSRVTELATGAGSPSGDEGGEGGRVTGVKLKRELDATRAELATLKKSLGDEKTKAQKKLLSAGLTKVAAEGRFNEPSAVVELLERHARVADDGEVVLVIPDGQGGEREVVATPQAIREHADAIRFPKIFFPADGVAGSGSRAPGQAGGLDMETVISDPELYEKNRDAIRRQYFGKSVPLAK
jgi:hypothetical protein